MAYNLPTDGSGYRFFGKKTADNNNAFMPSVIYGADGVTPISSSNPLPVQLTGSIVEKVVFDQRALTDINIVQSQVIDEFKKYPNKILMARNSHDKPVRIRALTSIRGANDYITELNTTGSVDVIMPANRSFQPAIITKNDFKVLEGILGYDTRLVINATETPTEGSVTITLVAWR